MFLRADHGLDGGGGASALTFGRAVAVTPTSRPFDAARERLHRIDPAPDLGMDIGSATWWRGAATCAALCAITWMLAPPLSRPILTHVAPPMAGADVDEARALSLAPLALGATTGRHMGATAAVVPLTDTPERPIIELGATLDAGSAIAATLERSGVGIADAARAADLISAHVPLDTLKPGTQLELTLGRRPSADVSRPLEKLALRARFDLDLNVSREAGALVARSIPIAIDRTPLRIQGQVGPSLYRAARAAGAPAKAVEAFIRSLASRMPISSVGTGSRFDIIVARERAATGEVQLGNLLYAGLDGAQKVQLVRWDEGGRTEWYDARGVGGETRGGATMPVAGRLTSGFGARRHPVLGYLRMHKGLDIAAPYGTPIHAAMDGVVALAGRSGGYGNFVKLNHGGGLATGYGHMSRIAVRGGMHVGRGQLIGYVGSTGLSTGPHVHYELWKNGVAVNPATLSFATVQRLTGADLATFRSRLAKLMAVPTGAGARPTT